MVPTYTLQNALADVFCFPYYTYPVLLIVSTSIQIMFAKCHEKYKKYEWVETNENNTNENNTNDQQHVNKRVQKDSQVVIDLIDKNKGLVVKYFERYSPLPKQIIHIIVNELYYNDDEKKLWCNELDKKADTVCKYFNRYLLLISIVYLWCFILIIWINIEWIDNNNINSWYGFQSFTLSMIMFHPASKIIPPIIAMVDEDDDIYKTSKISMIFNCVLIGPFNFCGYLIFGFPSIFYYIVIWMVYGLFIWLYMFVLIKLEKMDDDDSWCILLPTIFIYCSIMYGCIVYSMVSMSCVYSEELEGYGQWYMCLYQSFASPHCPNVTFIYIDWYNWKAICMLIAWILF